MSKSNFGHSLQLKGRNAENFVYELAQKSFITDWCYQNPKLNGKEICNLLIVYDEITIIWQIKDLKLDENEKHFVNVKYDVDKKEWSVIERPMISII